VKILGSIPREHLIGLLRKADLFVLPSRVAVFDLALLEAAALGTPVVTSRVGGNKEMFRTDDVHFVPADDPAAVAGAITDALSQPSVLRAKAERARQRVEADFSLGAMMRQYLALYREFANMPRYS
jgi:glycosyltransferase involved in cell wall biosynthesis